MFLDSGNIIFDETFCQTFSPIMVDEVPDFCFTMSPYGHRTKQLRLYWSTSEIVTKTGIASTKIRGRYKKLAVPKPFLRWS